MKPPTSEINMDVSRLFRGNLRSYQREGLRWLLELQRAGLCGILADEMGLGKTVQTIALLAWNAIYRNDWGPHLIVVPTSLLFNWEQELHTFLPGFKCICYYGDSVMRQKKRQGWVGTTPAASDKVRGKGRGGSPRAGGAKRTPKARGRTGGVKRVTKARRGSGSSSESEPEPKSRPQMVNIAVHPGGASSWCNVCVVSYALVVRDEAILRRKKWSYLILDEAHNIRNAQTQRWAKLLGFPSKHRLLLTGTPVQNSLDELWALLHFIMRARFSDLNRLNAWFAIPLRHALQGTNVANSENAGALAALRAGGDHSAEFLQSQLLNKLHRLIRPYILRRLKKDVESQLPGKYEHVLPCRLSHRQAQLYNRYIALHGRAEGLETALGRAGAVQGARADVDFGTGADAGRGALAALRRVCNHVALFSSTHPDTQITVTDKYPFTAIRVTPWRFRDRAQVAHNYNEVMGLLRGDAYEEAPLWVETPYVFRPGITLGIAEGMRSAGGLAVPSESPSGVPKAHGATTQGATTPSSKQQGSPSRAKASKKGSKKADPGKPTAPVTTRPPKLSELLIPTNIGTLHKLEEAEWAIRTAEGTAGKGGVVQQSKVSKRAGGLLSAAQRAALAWHVDREAYAIGAPGARPIASSAALLGAAADGAAPRTSYARTHALRSKNEDLRENKFQRSHARVSARLVAGATRTYWTRTVYSCGRPWGGALDRGKLPVSNSIRGADYGLLGGASGGAPGSAETSKYVFGHKVVLARAWRGDRASALFAPRVLTRRDLSAGSLTRPFVPLSRRVGRPKPRAPARPPPARAPRARAPPVAPAPAPAPTLSIAELCGGTDARALADAAQRLGPDEHVGAQQRLQRVWLGNYWAQLDRHYARTAPADEPAMNAPAAPGRYSDAVLRAFEVRRLPGERVIECHTEGCDCEYHDVRVAAPPRAHRHTNMSHGLLSGSYHVLTNLYAYTLEAWRAPLLRVRPTPRLGPLGTARVMAPDPLALQLSSGKLQQLDEIMRHAKRTGQRTLIFTQSNAMLDLLETWLLWRGYALLRLDGSTKVEERQRLVNAFNGGRHAAFLASTRAGGTGLNLVGASVVVFYDTDWNPAADRQAMDRCHRIGQTREVHVYRLICRGTVEENVWRTQLYKRALNTFVIDRAALSHEAARADEPPRAYKHFSRAAPDARADGIRVAGRWVPLYYDKLLDEPDAPQEDLLEDAPEDQPPPAQPELVAYAQRFFQANQMLSEKYVTSLKNFLATA